ncbi:sugar-binding protein [Rubellicoccus peritrichatus]|uniref:Sugar-binding protein n=1 Tax=Rubellicoccus peritrichatus TaxID=3080537 RepID=A0AAQ3LBM0_9BACT|nr:sugar-binding protein [Puniceicoccus sp. CR14]WOO42312.1 sugar-binding protein [Puniceicoccus sp. CR14]
MNNKRSLVLGLSLLTTITLSAEKIPGSMHTLQSIETSLDGKPYDFEYLEFLPADYSESDKSYPLILFLHGAGARGSDARELVKHHLPVVFEDKAEFPAIVISPQCPVGGWWSGETLDHVNLLLEEVTQNKRVDQDRIYITGLSMGGYGTWDMLRKYPDWFAAFASVCGGKGKNGMEGFIHIPGQALHGLEDNVVVPENTIEVVETFRKAGGDIEMTLYPDVGHDAWVPAYDPPELFLWLLNQKKDDPDFEYKPTAEEKEFFELWATGDTIVKQSPGLVKFPLHESEAEVTLTRINPTRYPVTEKLTWDVEGTHYTVNPKVATIEIPADGEATATFSISYEGDKFQLSPVPSFDSELVHKGKVFKKFSANMKFDDKEYFRGQVVRQSISPLEQAPTIDGTIDEAEWRNATPLTNLQLPNGRASYPSETMQLLGYDDEKLYVAVRIAEPNPKKLKMRHKHDTNVYRDDNAQVFIQPNPDSSDYYHIIVNPAGNTMDGLVHDRSWDGDYELKTNIGDNFWLVEMAIPWSTLGMEAPKPDTNIGFQFMARRTQAKDQTGQWAPTYHGWAHQPNRFGRLDFKGQ